MNRISVAFRAFFRVLGDARVAEQVDHVLAGKPAPPAALEPPPKPAAPAPKPAPKPQRSDALNLLAALQREGRLVDFLQEPIASYSDAQIGAAVRDIHRDCQKLLQRLFALAPVESAAEGSEIVVADGYDPARFRLVGNVAGQPPFRGQLCHHGWTATRCDLPEWTGGERSLMVVAPAEVEVK